MPFYKFASKHFPSSSLVRARLSLRNLPSRPIFNHSSLKVERGTTAAATHRLTSTLARKNSLRNLHHNPSRSRPVTTSKVLKSAGLMSFLTSFFTSTAQSEEAEDNMSYPDKRSADEWRAVLSPEQFKILRQKGTEPAYTGEYDKHYPEKGVYTCAGCNAPLYKASHKFKSGCGWPAYFDSVPGAVTRHTDNSFGMERTEIVCSNCGGHLGHVFKGEGYPTPTDERHCVNSISLKFTDDESKAEDADKRSAKA